ncbi:hypothetical protein EV421DRAFT_1289205 [Armillaria borealis]|uniref:Uncharacterized protein n=1 Tax=Armillaria borealis TaxID=47425 RepID=A0AA39JYL8_9AGAR|nr:hypothetical protein EV421DRAFT_1289205 [Armillaria borealis]
MAHIRKRSQDSSSSGNADAQPSPRTPSSSRSKSFLRRLSDAFSSSSADSSTDTPSALAQQRREEALRERGLLPPVTVATTPDSPPSSSEWDASALFEEVRLAREKASSQQGPTAAELVKKQWEQSDASSSIPHPSRFIEHIPAQDDVPPRICTSAPSVSFQRSNTRRPSTSPSSISPRKPRPLGPRNRSDTKSSSSSSFPPPLPKGASPPVAFVTRSAPPTPNSVHPSVSQRSRNKDLPPIRDNDPVADPVPRTRKPIQVTMHNRASLVIEAGQIADLESRRASEMAFLEL